MGEPEGRNTEIEARLETVLATLEMGATAEHRPGSTIDPPPRSDAHLGALLAKLGSDVERRFDVERTLGEGGMGVVHLAEQVALGRKVAIKTLRDGVAGSASVQKVLQEAWITGYLEHPNIVPVYDIARGDDGLPVIVLKRIEGDSLDTLLRDPKRMARRHGAEDPFEWALRVAIQVCQALGHAHQRGIVHRDVKAENIMVGSHGEVYLLDWGIAVAMRDDGTGRFPLASDATAVAGTPCYMAPEMLGGEQPELGPWTDVYLVGSLLFEICTGDPPHTGTTLMAIMRQVLDSPPEVPESVPDELRTIITRAMDADPHARFENADQIRLALEGFLRHRGSRQLAERADEAEVAMRTALASGDADAAEVAFAEARFGYRAALELWAENPEAKERLRRATETMLRAALKRGDPETAGRILATAEAVDPALRDEVKAARVADARRRAELAALEEDSDESRGRRTRAFLTLVLCSIWVIVPASSSHLGDAPNDPENLFYFSLGMVGITTALIFWARESMMATRINRTLASGLLATMTGQMILTLIGWKLGMEGFVIRTFWMVIYMISVLWVMAAVSAVLWPAAIAFGLAAVGATLYSDYTSYFMTGANAVLLVNLLAANRAIGVLRDTVEERRQKRSQKPPPAE